MDAVVCCIIKDETRYIMEFIKYYIKLGFSKIYIYDNSDTFELNGFFSNKDPNLVKKIVLLHAPGKYLQLPVYNHFIQTYSKSHTWVAFIDIDEFIVLEEWQPITQFLEKFCESGSLALNWRFFGDSYRRDYFDLPVTTRFLMCASGPDEHVKCISKCSDLQAMISPYFPILSNGNQKDSIGVSWGINDNRIINKNPTLKYAYINHYYVKSWDEWVNGKISKGMADHDERRDPNLFFIYNKNETVDPRAFLFLNDSSVDFSI